MAHGAGGKATQTLIEGLFAPAFGSAALAELADAGAVEVDGARPGADHRQLRRQAAALPRRLDRRAGGQRHRQRPRRRRRPAARAEPLADPRGGPRRRRADGPRSRRSPPPRAAAGVEIVAGDTKVVERGHADGCTSARPGSGASTRGRGSSPRGDPARRPDPRLRRRSASTAPRSCSPAASSSSTPTSSPTPARCGRRPTRCSRPAGEDLRCMRDATRGGVASVLNELARASRVAMVVREADVPVGAGGRRRRRRCSGSTRCTSPTRASWSPSSPPSGPRRRSTALRAVPGCEEAAEIGEVKTEPPGMVLVETAFGGRRVMDLLAGDPLPRIC